MHTYQDHTHTSWACAISLIEMLYHVLHVLEMIGIGMEIKSVKTRGIRKKATGNSGWEEIWRPTCTCTFAFHLLHVCMHVCMEVIMDRSPFLPMLNLLTSCFLNNHFTIVVFTSLFFSLRKLQSFLNAVTMYTYMYM